MVRKMTGFALIVVSDLLIVVCLTADLIGLGAAPQGLGYKQILGAVAGVVIQLAGIVLTQVESRPRTLVG